MSQRYGSPEPGVVQQTAILRDVELPEVVTRGDAAAEVAFVLYHWLVVLNQECDLLFDRLARRSTPVAEGKEPVKKHNLLRSILLCPAFLQDRVTAGTYIEGAKMWNSNEKRILQRNGEDRYHLLPAEEPLLTEPLVLDFKLIVAAPPEYVYTWLERHPDNVVAVLNAPFRDRLVQRFVNYFGRIAEPEEE